VAYRHRNLIEQLNDSRRIATRCDKLVRSLLAAIMLAATLTRCV